jgi:hypothetical protein
MNIQIHRPRYDTQQVINEILKYVHIESGTKNTKEKEWDELRQVLEAQQLNSEKP